MKRSVNSRPRAPFLQYLLRDAPRLAARGFNGDEKGSLIHVVLGEDGRSFE